MSYKFKAYIRVLLLSFVLIMSVLGVSAVSFAQTDGGSADAPATQETAPVTEPVLAPLPAPKAVSAEADLDLSDPALVEALDAREKADRAIAEAVRVQREAVAKVETEAETPAAPKKSLIPTSPDELKALGKKIGDTVLGWVTNPASAAHRETIAQACFLTTRCA